MGSCNQEAGIITNNIVLVSLYTFRYRYLKEISDHIGKYPRLLHYSVGVQGLKPLGYKLEVKGPTIPVVSGVYSGLGGKIRLSSPSSKPYIPLGFRV